MLDLNDLLLKTNFRNCVSKNIIKLKQVKYNKVKQFFKQHVIKFLIIERTGIFFSGPKVYAVTRNLYDYF